MKKPSYKKLSVIKSEQITPNMQRIVFHGDELAHFPEGCEGDYIKFLFNDAGETDLSAIIEDKRPIMRTYTIRHFSLSQRTIDIDFVRHSTENIQGGYAARWAKNAKVEDTINIVGPGTISDINTDVDWFFMVADMTAIPALSAKIRQLPDNAKGYAVIKVLDIDDIQPIEAPNNIKIIWLTDDGSLIGKVTSLPWLEGVVSVWAACEFDSMRELRTYFQNEKEVERENMYISSYWKRGITEDGHKMMKQKDANENN